MQQTVLKMFYPTMLDGTMEQIDMLFDPVFQEDQYYNEIQLTNQIYDSLNRLDLKNAYSAITSTLWNSGMPCSDFDSLKDYSVFKYCEWKGNQIPCSVIFSTYPTDQGMCCAFNIKAAEEMFIGETYSQLITNLQNNENFKETNFPFESYDAEPGINKGLRLVLDSHSDILSASSLDSDTHGFVGLISQSGSYPQHNFGGFDIKPGYKNSVALSATKITADNKLQDIDPLSRNCYFEWENIGLNIFKSYTQSNCIFECNFFYAQNVLRKQFPPCTPWYFPTPDATPRMCDPWQAANISEIMLNVPMDNCNYCLGDCESTIFKTRISAAPLQKCSLNSLGMNKFCHTKNGNDLGSQFLTEMIQSDSERRFSHLPYYYKDNFPSNRTIGSSLRAGDVFESTNEDYRAVDSDIAIVQIYFQTAYTTKIQRSLKMDWIDYFSNVGGIFGLVLGFLGI